MTGTIAITDHGWYDTLRRRQLDEVTFWKPSAARGFRAPEFSPFLFDQGCVSVTPDLRIEVSDRLRTDYRNGKSYYPFRDQPLHLPRDVRDLPNRTFLERHRDCRYLR
jgi:hypothetical protein